MSDLVHALECDAPSMLCDHAWGEVLLWSGRVVMRCDGPGWYVGDLGTGMRHQLTPETLVQRVTGFRVVPPEERRKKQPPPVAAEEG